MEPGGPAEGLAPDNLERLVEAAEADPDDQLAQELADHARALLQSYRGEIALAPEEIASHAEAMILITGDQASASRGKTPATRGKLGDAQIEANQ